MVTKLFQQVVYNLNPFDIETAVQRIAIYLEDTSNNTKAIYFDGWSGLCASVVLRAIAKHPPPSVSEKFDKIIHIDCSRWKSRRALQRAIADELKLTQQVAADFDRQEEEDDFNRVDQGSRFEIGRVATLIARSLAQCRCLVVFHNGSNDMVDLTRCGVMLHDLFHTRVLWTYRGRLRLNRYINEYVDISYPCTYLRCYYPNYSETKWNELLAEEAREIALYTHKLGLGITPSIATECCLYFLSMSCPDGEASSVIDYHWTTHAASYWVCDGVVRGGQDDQAWELAHALQHNMRLEDDISSTTVPYIVNLLDISMEHWISTVNSNFQEVPRGTTSLFFASQNQGLPFSFRSDMFHGADQLRVLKLCRCAFSFSSPPFHCCHNLRFLGLDICKDEQQQQQGEEDRTGARALETFKRLWVLDVSHTDWELAFPIETEEPTVATDIREVHVNRGRVWCSSFAWRRLPNLHRLRVVEPTSPWETAGREDEFMDMIKLELLDLSGNSTIRVLPSLSDAGNLKTLILDGCVGLEHVGPHDLPPSLESFYFDSGLGEDDENKAKISSISLAGCARLVDFRLHGSLPNLEELDLSHTAVKMLDLKDKAAVQCLQKVFLVGCEQLRSISWPDWISRWHTIRLLCIDTRAGGEVARKPSSCDSLMGCQGKGDDREYLHAFIGFTDMRFIQSLIFPMGKVNMNFCWSSSSKDDGSSGRIAAGSPLLARSLTYNDVSSKHQIATQIDGSGSTTTPFQPLDVHMEIGEGVSDIPNLFMEQGSIEICYLMSMAVMSLHVHDSSSITDVTPEHIFLPHRNSWGVMNQLRRCRVERCRRLQTVFTTQYNGVSFHSLETFWAAHLLMARSIWRCSPKRTTRSEWNWRSFEALRAIHLHFCPRLRYVHTLSWNDDLFNHLETLHILCCGDLRQVFPLEQEVLEKIVASHEAQGMLAFPKLKYLYLHHLSSLQQICEAKMYAPYLETIYIRGCWGLKRLPATDSRRHQEGRPVSVDCEKEWWDKLEWDGMETGHHPSLFEPRHSKYYKKRHLRSTVLR